MLWIVTGGICSGKSAFAEELAYTVGREGIWLSCPSFPERYSAGRQADSEHHANFLWTALEADEDLAHKLNAINLESNIFRADRRVIVVDSLSGWLRGLFHQVKADAPETDDRIDGEWQLLLEAILSFQGKMIVVTEDIAAGLSISSRELNYAYRLATANRMLLEAGTTMYRMTAGMATEVKGYRLKRGNSEDEDLHSHR